MKTSFTSSWRRGAVAAGLLGLLSSAAQAQTPAWSRAVGIGSAGSDLGRAIAVDGAGNTYVAGTYTSTTLTIGTTTLNNPGAVVLSTADIFVAKYGPTGTPLWATRLGGTNSETVGNLAVDNATGNVYLAGSFSGSLTVAGTTLTSAGANDMMLAMLNASGVPQWAMRAGGPADDIGAAVALDNNGFVWLGGSFQGTATVTGASSNLVSAGDYDQALIKCSAATGAYVRMGREGGSGNDQLRALAADATTLVAAGFFAGANLPVAGGPNLTRRCVNTDGYLIKYDQFITPQWAKSEGASGATSYANYAVSLDAGGIITTAGDFQGTIVVGNFDTIVNGGTAPAPMAVRYAAAGNVTSGRGTVNSAGRATSIVRDAAGNAYVSGYFSGTIQWSLSTATAAGSNDVFVAKLPATGNAQWVVRAGSAADDQASALAVDAAGNCYVTGFSAGSATFGALTALPNAGTNDAFVAKLGSFALATRAARAAEPLQAWPNPVAADRTLHLTLPGRGPATLRLFDLTGRLAYEQPLPATAQPVLTLPATLAPGHYLAEVQSATQLLRRGLVVQ